MQPPTGPPGIYLPDVSITASGQPLKPTVAHRVSRVSVTQRSDPPDQFSFDVYDPDLALIGTASGPLTEGTVVEIGLGYSGQTQRLITGRITSLAAEFPADGPPVLHVDGFDLLHDLARGTAFRVFAGATPGSGLPDSQVIATLARDVGLTPVVTTTPQRNAPRVQNNVSDLTLARQLAALNGFALWADGRTLNFAPSRPASGLPIELAWGKTLGSFTPRLSISGQVTAVEVRGWDPAQKQSFAYRSGGSDNPVLAATGSEAVRRGSGLDSVLVIADAAVSSASEARTLADQTLAALSRGVVTGDGTCPGQPAMRAGSQLELTGLGRFSGSYTVSEVTHAFGNAGYLTSFRVNGAAGGDEDRSPGSVAGLETGVLAGLVTSNADSQRRGRVEITVPALGDQVRLWARLSTLMAGPGRGTLFLPEVGDEVLVAFEQGDLGRPFVVGALWNGKDTPPGPSGDENNQRLIRSRSGHLIRLDDTSGAEKIDIVSSDGAQQVTLDTQGHQVTVRSQGTISLEADEIKIAARAALTISGQTVDIN